MHKPSNCVKLCRFYYTNTVDEYFSTFQRRLSHDTLPRYAALCTVGHSGKDNLVIMNT